ncbi:metal-sensitive transcriptional regulator [Amycolatopsis pigmentata]|uniref:Metal-sensitive transcriptional regulator n=1 Tax=Amycolatopsis pigmentata TaxID=450801 RepID=A0ABW5FQB2_9PSEU
MASDQTHTDAHLTRLRRIEGQIRGLQRMIEADAYSIDVLTQGSSATKASQSFALALLDEHLSTCVTDAANAGGPDARRKVREASEAIARLLKS